MISANYLRYGNGAPLPEQILLSAGPLSMIYENGDLRLIKFGAHEIIRRIYVAVRDRNWGTVLPVFLDVQMDIHPDSFQITYTAENKEDEIYFTWNGLITGDTNGKLTFSMQGHAQAAFAANRIGFCVLYPASLAGVSCTLSHIDGSLHQAAFPLHPNPDQPPIPFTDLSSMRYQVGPARIDVCFTGDVFEMEDQRNWTDASFKIFCPPLRYTHPVEIQAGMNLVQTITVEVIDDMAASQHITDAESGLTLVVNPEPIGLLPALGLGISSRGGGLSPREVARLKALKLAHLRADIDLTDPAYPDVLRRAVAESQAAGAPLYLALHLSDVHQLGSFLPYLNEIKPEVALWLIYPALEDYQRGTPISQMLALVKKFLPGPFAAGTDTDFIFFQRNIPPAADLDAVTFSINPQVHAFDNLSVVETLEAQTQVVQAAQRLVGATPVIVSPITLKPRFNPYASGPVAPIPPGELPPQVDARQSSLFTAAWTVGSVQAMALGGARSVTYYETIGWRGVMEHGEGSPLPAKFYSIPGGVYPVYHIFSALADFNGADVLSTTSNNPLKVQGLALRKEGRMRLLIANLSPETQTFILKGLPLTATFTLLDETTASEAMQFPETFRSRHAMKILTGLHGLRPYAVAMLDFNL